MSDREARTLRDALILLSVFYDFRPFRLHTAAGSYQWTRL